MPDWIRGEPSPTALSRGSLRQSMSRRRRETLSESPLDPNDSDAQLEANRELAEEDLADHDVIREPLRLA